MMMYSLACVLRPLYPCLPLNLPFTDIQRHPPVYLTILGVAVNKRTTITVVTSIATTFVVFAVNQAPNFANQLTTCPLFNANNPDICWS